MGTAKADRAPKGPPSRVGTIIADTYRVLDRLGSGSMGEVYRAEHLRLGRQVALKLPRMGADDNARALERFRQEVAVLSRLYNRHVVTILDCSGMNDAEPYLVMELLHGESLRDLLAREGPLPVERAVSLVRDLCAGLRAVHAAGVIHRDLKPSNVFIVRDPNEDEPCKILDFGVAKAGSSDTTHPGVILGTIRYMAPEQLRDATRVAPATDVYAAGAILYECLTGRPARPEKTPEELMLAVLQDEVTPITQFKPEVPAGLAAVVERALARSERLRFPDARSFADALRPFAPGAPPLRRTDETTRDWSEVDAPAPREGRRTGLILVTLLGAGLALGAGSALGRELGFKQATSLPRPPRSAVSQRAINEPVPGERTASADEDRDPSARALPLARDLEDRSPVVAGPERQGNDAGARTKSNFARADTRAAQQTKPSTDTSASGVAPLVEIDTANPYAD